MLIDYAQLAHLFLSHREEVEDLLLRRAEQLEIRGDVNRALAALTTEPDDLTTTQQRTEEAFRLIQWRASRTPSYRRFARFANELTHVAEQKQRTQHEARHLLELHDGERALLISQPVRAHLQLIIDMLDRLGLHHLYEPQTWAPLIQDASDDISTIGLIVDEFLKQREKPHASGLKALAQRVNRARMQTMREYGGSLREILQKKGVELNKALQSGAHHQFLQLLLEQWVLSVEADGPFDRYQDFVKPQSGFFPTRMQPTPLEPSARCDTFAAWSGALSQPSDKIAPMQPTSPIIGAKIYCAGIGSTPISTLSPHWGFPAFSPCHL